MSPTYKTLVIAGAGIGMGCGITEDHAQY